MRRPCPPPLPPAPAFTPVGNDAIGKWAESEYIRCSTWYDQPNAFVSCYNGLSWPAGVVYSLSLTFDKAMFGLRASVGRGISSH